MGSQESTAAPPPRSPPTSSSKTNRSENPSGGGTVLNGPDVCGTHSRNYELYCIDCKICLCNLCMIHSIHESHVFQNLSTIYNSQSGILHNGMSKIQDYLSKLDDVKQKMEDNIKEMEETKNLIVQKLLPQDDIDRINKLFEMKKASILPKKIDVSNMISNITRSFLEDEATIWNRSKSEFLQDTPRILQKYGKFLVVPIPDYEKQTISFISDQLSQMLEKEIIDQSSLEAGPKTIFFLDEQNFTWKLVLSLDKTTVQPCYKARFSIEIGVFDEPFKYRIIVKHPSDCSKDIILEFMDEFYEGFGITILVGVKSRLENMGFFETNQNLEFIFSVEPVNKMRCLLQWNKILVDKSNLSMQIEVLTKMADEIKELRKSSSLCSVYLNLKRQGKDIKNQPNSNEWISAKFNDCIGNIWQVQMKIDFEENKTLFSLLLVQGRRKNIPYIIKMADPPGQLKNFTEYSFKSPERDNQSVEICVKECNFKYNDKKNIMLAVKIRPNED